MSVSGMIDNPINAIENDFFFPIAVERVYKDYWHKFAKENNLFWMQLFLGGVVLERKFFKEVLTEINVFKSYLLENLDPFYMKESEHILNRIDLFIDKLNEAYNLRDDIILYIG